jgi:hypothetical protein
LVSVTVKQAPPAWVFGKILVAVIGIAVLDMKSAVDMTLLT